MTCHYLPLNVDICIKCSGYVTYKTNSTFLNSMFRYDEDYNHEPCQRNGQKAHWAVASGKTSPLFHKGGSEKQGLLQKTDLKLTKDQDQSVFIKLVYVMTLEQT